MSIDKLLIANRGEIACRIARAARACGITPIAVYSDADAGALHVREIERSLHIGPGPAADSYLRIDAALEAASSAGADAIHPGYGFLAENPDFARAVEDAGLIFVGPTSDTLEHFGNKDRAKKIAAAAGVPVIRGRDGALADVDTIAAEVRQMGLPVLLKAVAGGGGRGQRLVEREDTLEHDIEAALREAKNALGSEGLLLERFLRDVRHVEIQIAGDGRGNVIHLFERDCSLQRRHQKVIEEAPAFGLERSFIDRMAGDAVRLCESCNYRVLGTVEFLVSGENYFFLEVNPRLQVEHPVTEAVTGLDLVALQLRIAAGEGLGLRQRDIRLDGHAVEARVYAEEPANNFAPSTGRITALSLPEEIRVDRGVARGDRVSPYYDPMIAKLIVHEADRDTALSRLAKALKRTAIVGVDTNLNFLSALVEHADVHAMHIHTRWIDGHIEELTTQADDPDLERWMAVAAAIWLQHDRTTGDVDPWRRRDLFTGWRLGLGDPGLNATASVRVSQGHKTCEVRVSPIGPLGRLTAIVDEMEPLKLQLQALSSNRWHLSFARAVILVTVRCGATDIEIDAPDRLYAFGIAPTLAAATRRTAGEGSLASPLTGAIVKVMAREGDMIAAGATIAILESMKMEIPIKSVSAGRVTALTAREGEMVERGQIIAEISAD